MNKLDGDEQKTHIFISKDLVGEVKWIEGGKASRVELKMNEDMKADSRGLVHGGFTFGLADYAAMVAVNEPWVVLLSSTVKFLKPVTVGDPLTAEARITHTEGKKRKIWCEVFNQDREKVFEGEFLCYVPNKHVLDL
jgi:uncharacterized protein (TIGR00369 family)